MSIHGEVNEVIKTRFRTAQMQSLSGVGHWHEIGDELCVLADKDVEECMGHDPLDLVEQDLYTALGTVILARNHEHKVFYNHNGICGVCGWDGNA